MFDFAVSYTQGATGLSPQTPSDDFALFETGNDNESLGIAAKGNQIVATLIVPTEKAEALNINLDKMWLGVTRPSDGAYTCMVISRFIRIETAIYISVDLNGDLTGMAEAALDILIAALMRA
jgi:hypothetical protein